MRAPPKHLHFVHPAHRTSVKRGERTRGHRWFSLLSVEVHLDTRHAVVRTHDAWGYDRDDAKGNEFADGSVGNLTWTFHWRRALPDLVGVAVPGSGFSVEPETPALAWVKKHVRAAIEKEQATQERPAK